MQQLRSNLFDIGNWYAVCRECGHYRLVQHTSWWPTANYREHEEIEQILAGLSECDCEHEREESLLAEFEPGPDQQAMGGQHHGSVGTSTRDETPAQWRARIRWAHVEDGVQPPSDDDLKRLEAFEAERP